jgi:glycosyltransferase involved in cell wall biosynthesis
MKSKVLLVGTLTSRLNGSARSFVKVGKALKERGHTVVSVLPDRSGIHSDSVSSHDKVLVANIVPVRRSFLAILNIPASMIRFALIVAKEKPNSIHINDIPWFYLIVVARLFRKRVSIHSRYVEPNLYVSRFIKTFLHHTAKVLFVSEYNKKLWGYRHENGVVLNNPGIRFAESGEAVTPVTDPYLLVVSRISPDKGIFEAIKFFYLISRMPGNSSLRLKVAGGCQYRYQEIYEEKCRLLIRKLGLSDKVDWLGSVDNTASLFLGARAYIHLPNFEDPFPTTIMEALAFGTYIVTNARGGIPEQVDGFEGVHILAQDIIDRLYSLDAEQLMGFQHPDLGLLAIPKKPGAGFSRSGLYEKRFSWDFFAVRLENYVCQAGSSALYANEL